MPRFLPLLLAIPVAALLLAVSSDARADTPPAAWPVRINVSLPLGYTWGDDKLRGFTWGFRGSVEAYPTKGGRGVGVGGYGELMMDAQTDTRLGLGALVTAPVVSGDWAALRVGGTAGWSWGDNGGMSNGLSVGAFSNVAMPVYLYDLRAGLVVRGFFTDKGLSSTSVLFDVDLVGLLGAIGWAYGSK
jgi:hypothetical protein